MIFSMQKLQTAMGFLAGCYDKIIFVNLDEDSWEPIKINEDEWEANKDLGISEWLFNFANSDDCRGFEVVPLLMNIRAGIPYAKNYIKRIGWVDHLVTIEYLPIDKGLGYILVFDHETFKRGETCGEKV